MPGRVVLKLSGCDTISQAEALAGRQLLIRADSLPKLAEDTFYVGDLLECDLFDGLQRVGRIVDVEFATAPDGRTRLEDAAPLLAVERAPAPSRSWFPSSALGSTCGSRQPTAWSCICPPASSTVQSRKQMQPRKTPRPLRNLRELRVKAFAFAFTIHRKLNPSPSLLIPIPYFLFPVLCASTSSPSFPTSFADPSTTGFWSEPCAPVSPRCTPMTSAPSPMTAIAP